MSHWVLPTARADPHLCTMGPVLPALTLRVRKVERRATNDYARRAAGSSSDECALAQTGRRLAERAAYDPEPASPDP